MKLATLLTVVVLTMFNSRALAEQPEQETYTQICMRNQQAGAANGCTNNAKYKVIFGIGPRGDIQLTGKGVSLYFKRLSTVTTTERNPEGKMTTTLRMVDESGAPCLVGYNNDGSMFGVQWTSLGAVMILTR